MKKEAIILAGGLGTRLRSVVTDLPKCMAPVNGKPFLHYVISYLQQQGTHHFIFSLGYLSEAIEQYLRQHHPHLHYSISLEDEPLGTGGAIKLACSKALQPDVLVLNGDTMFTADTNALYQQHISKKAACTLCLKPMNNFDRYGVVETDENDGIISFREKQYYNSGLINGGIYLVNKASLMEKEMPVKFSFEKDYLEKFAGEGKFFGIKQDAYFIDIGIPEDFERAQTELKKLSF